MESSGFDATISLPSDAERLTASGATCDCYRIRRYGKLLFVKRRVVAEGHCYSTQH